MPREDIAARLERLGQQIAQLEGAWAAGQHTPGLRGRLRFLQRRRAWYEARSYGLSTRSRTFSLEQPRKRKPPTTPDDLILDVRALL